MKIHLIAWADKTMNRWLSQVVDLSDPPQGSPEQTQRPVRECPAITAIGQHWAGLIAADCGDSERESQNADEFVRT